MIKVPMGKEHEAACGHRMVEFSAERFLVAVEGDSHVEVADGLAVGDEDITARTPDVHSPNL